MPFLTDEEKQSLLDRYFDIQWCDDVSDLRCVHCHRVAIHHYVSSCQHLFCSNCSRLYNDEERQSNCPRCQEHIVQLVDQDFDVDIKIHQLKMCCPNKKYGCNYSDQLRKLPLHLLACKGPGQGALPVESPGTNTMADVVKQLKTVSATIGELKGQVNQLERKKCNSDNKVNASTSGRDTQLASNNYAEEFQSMRELLESINQRTQQNELLVQQMSSNMEEMRAKIASMAEEINALQNKNADELIPQTAESYEWTINNAKKNILKKNNSYDSEIFNLPGYRFNIKATIQRFDELSFIRLQIKYGNKIMKAFLDNDGFGAVEYIFRDQSNTEQKKDIVCKTFLTINDGSCNLGWLFGCLLPDEVFAPPYLKDDCIKITITLAPLTIDRSFVSNNGILEWRLDNYRKRTEEQLFSPIFSPTFYTSPRGYRMILQLIIIGPDLCVIPIILTGEHDSRLPLEFPRKTTVTLINRTDPSKNLVRINHSQDLKPDWMVFSSESLEDGGIIKDDCHLLRVVIEPVARK